jgi:hypothetical protein
MATPININIGDLGETITTPGDYDVVFLANAGTLNFSGLGTYTLSGLTASAVSNYTIEASNGANVVVDSLATVGSNANIIVNGASTVTFGSTITALGGTTAAFAGAPGGQLIFPSGLLSLLSTPPTVTGFQAGDAIGFGTPINPGDSFSYNATTGVLQLNVPPTLLNPLGNGGSVVLSPAANYTTADFSITGAAGTAEIIYNTVIACFLRGTAIRTPDGDVPVETLQAGDLVSTLDGPKPIIAVRTRSFEIEATGDDEVRPIRIAAGALGENKPVRDLFVSPEHAMYLDGVLVLAGQIQNGLTISPRAGSGTVDYVHIEIDPHGILFAEGAETESYLDVGNRSHFLRPGTVTLFPSVDPRTWEDACAPLVLAGPVLEGIRDRLAARAAADQLDRAA